MSLALLAEALEVILNCSDSISYELNDMSDSERKQRTERVVALQREAVQLELVANKLANALERPKQSPVAEVIECPVMGQQTLQECGDGWKSLRYGDLLYTAPPAPDADRLDAQRYRYMRSGKLPHYISMAILNDSPEGIDASIDAAMKGGPP